MTKRELTEKLKRTAVTFQVGGFKPDDRLLSSWIGKVMVGAPGEEWPLSNGYALTPICQINLTELPFKPKRLNDVDLITLFVNEQALPNDEVNGQNWLIRTYSNLNQLAPIKPPSMKFKIKSFPLKPQLIEADFPCYEDCPLELPEELEDNYCDFFPNAGGIKLGGWPTLIQGEIYWAPLNQHPAEPEYVFQIDSIDKAGWQWGDGGVAYVGRGTKPGHENEWTFSWQCY